jgi:hypothetical protein
MVVVIMSPGFWDEVNSHEEIDLLFGRITK